MSTLKKVIVDAVLSTTGTVAAMVAGLAVMPRLIGVMGDATYGLWTLIAGLSVYLGILDFGVTAAVCRLSARSRVAHGREEMNELMSTAVALLGSLSAFLCLLTWYAPRLFLYIFPVSPSLANDVREALLVVGLTIAVTVPFDAFNGLLWAYERFDIINAIGVLSSLVRAVLIFVYVGGKRPLFDVALINAVVALAVSASYFVFAREVSLELQIRLRNIRLKRARELIAFGKWMNMLAITKALLPQVIAAMIAKLINASELTTFAVARQLVFYTNDFSNSATQVVAPRAARLDASGDIANQQSLLIDGGRVSYALGLFFFGGYLTLGAQFIHLWQRGRQDAAYIPLVLLMAGEVIPISQLVTYGQIVGAMRQRLLGYLSIAEILILAAACLFVLPRFGLLGGCGLIAIVGCAIRGVFRLWYGCRVMGVHAASVVRRVFAGVSLRAAAAIILVLLFVQWLRPVGWESVMACAVLYAAVFLSLVGIPLLGFQRLKALAVSFAQPGR